jgi:hypothetical protein
VSGTSRTLAVTIHNERRKLFATMLNTLASSSCTIGVLTPIAAAVFYGAAPKGLGIGAIIVGAVFWLGTAVVLHNRARRVLGGLRE